jgi:hypothetical protein
MRGSTEITGVPKKNYGTDFSNYFTEQTSELVIKKL